MVGIICVCACFQFVTGNSVARVGSCSPPHWPEKHAKYRVFNVLLRPIFAPKMKTATPMRLGSKSSEGLAAIWTRKMELFFLDLTQSWLGKLTEFRWKPSFFFRKNRFNFRENLLFFFRRSPNSGRKNPFQILWKPFFLLEITWFWQKNASIWFKTDKNLSQVPLLLFQLPKKHPPFANSRLRAWLPVLIFSLKIALN